MSLALVVRFYPGGEVLLHNIHFHWWKEFAIGKHIQTILVAADARPLLYMAIPRCDVFVSDRPIHAVPILCVGFEIQITEPIALATPCQRTAADVATAIPIKAFRSEERR